MMSLVASDQTREPSGSPRGGQFAGRANTPPEGALAESATGTFAFPPRSFGSVEEYIEFFETVPISDRVLSNARHAYRKWRQDTINRKVNEAYAIYGNDPQVVAEARKHPLVSEQKAELFVMAERAKAAAEIPDETIDPNNMRSILRAHQLWYYRRTVADGTAEAEIVSSRMAGLTSTVQSIVDEWRTPEWAFRAMTESDLAAVDAMEEMAATLREIRGRPD